MWLRYKTERQKMQKNLHFSELCIYSTKHHNVTMWRVFPGHHTYVLIILFTRYSLVSFPLHHHIALRLQWTYTTTSPPSQLNNSSERWVYGGNLSRDSAETRHPWPHTEKVLFLQILKNNRGTCIYIDISVYKDTLPLRKPVAVNYLSYNINC